MATFQKFNCFVQDIGRGLHNLNTDTLKVMLTNTAPLATNTIKADITEIAAGNGYTAGGTAIANTSYSQTGGVATLFGDDVTFTASGGAIATFRYVVIYNDTSATKPLICFYDYGSSISPNSGEFFLVDFPATEILDLA